MPVTGPSTARALLRETLSAVRRDVVLCVASGLAWQAVAVAVPWVLERVVDDGVVDGDRRALWVWTGVLVVLGVVRWVGDAARHWWVERAGAHAADHLRRRFVDRLLAMSDDEMARFGHGDLTARAVGDTKAVWNWVAGVATLATASFTLLAVLGLLVTLDPALALVGLATIPLAAALAAVQVGAHGRAAALTAGGSGDYAGTVEAAVAGARTIKGLGAERVVLARATAASATLRDRTLALARVEARWLAAVAAIPAAGIAAGLWVGGTRAIDGTITVGALVAFAGWMGLLVDATTTLTERLVDRGAASAAAGRLAEVLDHQRPPVASRSAGPLATGVVPPAPNDITVDGVAAQLGGRVVLGYVDIDVPAGGWLAVVGATGSGKSTLLRMMAGLDPPAAGTVRVGGTDLTTLDPTSVRSAVVLVPQGAGPVSGPVADFLRLAAPDATDDELHVALDTAGATDVVGELGGLGGRIGDRGLTLSGGQRQRLALAVAALRRPPVLLLDDTTSALDPTTEAAVLVSLRRQLPGTTVVIATHRATTAAACDSIVLLADGCVVTAGEADAIDELLDPTRRTVR